MRDFYYVDAGGILSYPDSRPMSPAEAAAKINRLVRDNTRYRDRLQIDPGGSDNIDELQDAAQFLRHRVETAETRVDAFQAQAIEHQADVVALRHDLEVAEHERDEARKELEEWRHAHSQPICNPPEATGEYVDVMGEMTIPFTVQLPVELCHEQIACDDPAIEAALQAVSGHICTYIWGEDKKPAVVYCDVGEQNVEIESDDRTCLEKDSTRLTDKAVNSGSCNDGDLDRADLPEDRCQCTNPTPRKPGSVLCAHCLGNLW